MTPDEELNQMEGDWNMLLDLMDGYRKRWEDEKAETARLRAELDAAPTATLRQQLAGSQSALSKVMGELTEAREQLERRRIDYAKVQADLYNQIEAEKAQTVEAYRQRDVARAALAEAERERDEAVGRLNKAVIDIAHGATEAVKWEKRAREAERKLSVSETLRAAASQSGNEVAKSTLDYYAMEKRKARTYEKLAATYAAIASRQRRTIRALVVAARVARLAAVGFAFIAGVGPRRVHDEIRFGIKQADHRAGEE